MKRSHLFIALVVALSLVLGIFLRLRPTSASGFDENVYQIYLEHLQQAGGIAHYGEIVRYYEVGQEQTHDAIVHPLRMVYLVVSYGWMRLFHVQPLAALHAVSALAGVLHLLVAGVFAWRLGGRRFLAGVLMLTAFAPLQICLAQRALVDGIYAMEALLCLWLLWENLQSTNDWRWLAAYGVSLFLLVMTKEYAAFAVLAFFCILVINRWARFGKATPALFAVTVAGPALAVVVLAAYAGGPAAFIHLYTELIQKSRTLDYAIYLQDGPWCRYLLDFMLVTPVVMLLAIGRTFQISGRNKGDLFCLLFIVFTYLPMANVSRGMSLRFAGFWDVPLCWLAFSQLAVMARQAPHRWKVTTLVATTVLVCGVEFWQFERIFTDVVQPPVYDPITLHLLRAVKIVSFK